MFYDHANCDVALQTSLTRNAAYSAGMKFLVYGRMLRPPTLLNPGRKVPVKWHHGYSENYYPLQLGPIMSSTWRAPDGSFGLVLYNIDTEEREITVELNRATYELGDGVFKALYPKDLSFAVKEADGNYLLNLKIAGYSPAIIEMP